MTPSTWVIVADGARARFFERNKDRTLKEFDALVSPEGRLHEGQLTADRAGRTFDSRGRGRHAMEPRHSAREQQATVFAKQLAEHIDDARVAGYLDRLVLVAPPKFLGELRTSLCPGAREVLVHSIDKELTTASAEEVAGHVNSELGRGH